MDKQHCFQCKQKEKLLNFYACSVSIQEIAAGIYFTLSLRRLTDNDSMQINFYYLIVKSRNFLLLCLTAFDTEFRLENR